MRMAAPSRYLVRLVGLFFCCRIWRNLPVLLGAILFGLIELILGIVKYAKADNIE